VCSLFNTSPTKKHVPLFFSEPASLSFADGYPSQRKNPILHFESDPNKYNSESAQIISLAALSRLCSILISVDP
jgi:hypothetical protein